MHVIIFGAAGFIGKKLALALLKRGKLSTDGLQEKEIQKLVLADISVPIGIPDDPRVEFAVGNISDENYIRNLLQDPPDVIFHLAAIVSGEAEKDFDLGMRVNLHANLQLLEILREKSFKPLLVFASTCGVFGGYLDMTIEDHTAARPQSSYGTQKAITELLFNDYSRRGFIDARIIRLPTIIVRPGKPNAATSSFASSIIRDPLEGKAYICPVEKETKMWVLSPRRVVSNFIHASLLDAGRLGKDRIITLPGITVSVAEMVQSLKEISGENTTDLIDWQPDPFIQSIVHTWPPHFETKRANELGFKGDRSIGEIIEAFIEDELN